MERLLNQARTALNRRQVDEAERALFGVLALASDCAEANRLMGVVAQMRGDHANAIRFLQQALSRNPNDAVTHMNLGTAQFEAGATDAGLASLRQACELAPGNASGWYNLGKALKLQVRYEEARDAFQQALSLDAAHVLARIGLADAQTGLGDIAQAAKNHREVLRRQPEQPHAWFSLSNLKTEAFSAADAVRLHRAFSRSQTPVEDRVMLGFALARAIEDQGDYAAAFAVLQQANAIKRRTVKWDSSAEHARVDAIMQAFSTPASAPLDSSLGREVIFIVSLPRSGSTLTEQILASHPQVEGANEITDLPQVIEDESKRRGKRFPHWVGDATPADWTRLGREYLARTERWRVQRPRFTDKNLVTWQLVGAIRRMLPAASVVNCHRDPLETCFACYRQLFSNGAHFSYELADMAAQYNEYARLSRYWQAQYPQSIFDHSHDALLADPESRIRRLLGFCGLTFDPGCLSPHLSTRTVRSTASAAQVRQPLRVMAPNSDNYAAQLAPLKARLHETGLLANEEG